MEFPTAMLVAFNPIQPIVDLLHAALTFLHAGLHNYGWSLIVLALIVKAAFWPLNSMQFKAMLKTQQIAPKLKALQAKYKNDRERLNTETMALYRETGANPLAGCLPILLQMPILISLYWAVITDKARFATESWLWIGSGFAATTPVFSAASQPGDKDIHPAFHLLVTSLAAPDLFLLALYVVSMYFSVRLTSPATDPQQAQQQKIMAFISPVMIAYLGLRYAWPSALIIYWLSLNVFTMAQQFYLINKYHRNPAGIGPHPEVAVQGATVEPAAVRSGKTLTASRQAVPSGGSRAARRRRNSRR